MMQRDHRIHIFCMIVFFFLLYALVAARLFWVQVLQRDFFIDMGRQQYGLGVKVSPPRGVIVDRNNKPLVLNKLVLSAFVLPRSSNDKQALMQFLHEKFPEVHDRIVKHPERYFFWLERRLDKAQCDSIAAQNFPEIHFAQESVRHYPFLDLAHVVGFTDVDNCGIAGLELAFDKKLAGTPEQMQLAKDARARKFYFEKTMEKEGTSGRSLKITIDQTLQFLLHRDLADWVASLKAKQGAVVVMNPYTGEIISMVSSPGFDPNTFKGGDLSVTKNVAVTECHEPGSVMKVFAALAGLEEGVVDFNEMFDCGGRVSYLKGLRIEHQLSLPDGPLPFCEAVKQSFNFVMAQVGLRLEEKLYDHLTRLGFGRKTYLGFPGERGGFVNHPKNWTKFSVMVMMFGYEATVTLMQIARATAIIANGGHYVEPFLVYDESNLQQGQMHEKKLYSDKSIEEISSILEKVGERYPVKGLKLLGKTGTARMVVDGHYSAQKHVYFFAGIVSKDDYKRVVVAFVREPEKANLWAAQATAPLVQKAAERLAVYDFSKGTLK